jgi:hypothetical protein
MVIPEGVVLFSAALYYYPRLSKLGAGTRSIQAGMEIQRIRLVPSHWSLLTRGMLWRSWCEIKDVCMLMDLKSQLYPDLVRVHSDPLGLWMIMIFIAVILDPAGASHVIEHRVLCFAR